MLEIRGEEVQLLLILDFGTRWVSGQRHAPAALYPLEGTSSTHWLGDCVGIRVGLDTEDRRNILASAGDRSPIVQFVIRLYID
jgi:hypothetical protein